MTKTENYQLPQWGAADPVRVDELRGAMAGIDGALVKAGAALTEERTARAQADAALSRRVDAAQDTADRALAALPYVVGTYTGDGTNNRHITVGFRPRFLIVCHTKEGGNGSGASYDLFMAVTGGHVPLHTIMQLTDDGFTVHDLASDGTTYYATPQLNHTDKVYDYIAFR